MIKKMSFLLVLAALLAACVPVTPTAVVTEQPTEPPTEVVVLPTPTFETYHLTIAAYPYMTEAPYFIAQEEGYFAEQGLEVEFIRFEKSADVIPALISGQLDATTALPSPALLNAIGRDAAIRIVAGKGWIDPAATCSHVGLMVRPDVLASGVMDDPQNWIGMSYATDKGTLVEYAISKYLDQYGIGLDQLENLELPITSRLEALQNGALDIASAGEPWITRITNAGAGQVWVSLEGMIPESQYGMIMFGPSLLVDHPDVGQRFMVAMLKAFAKYNEGKTETNTGIIAQYTQMDPAEIQQACWQSIRLDGDVNVQSILDYQTWAVEQGYVTDPVTAEQLWNPSFVEYARQFLP